MADGRYEVELVFTLNEASARRANEHAQRIFGSSGNWGPGGGGGGPGGGGPGGGSGAGGRPSPIIGGSDAGREAKRVSSQFQRLHTALDMSIAELKRLSRTAGDVSAAMKILQQQAMQRRYGSNTPDYVQRRAYDRFERSAGAFEGGRRAREDGSYGGKAGSLYDESYVQARHAAARTTELNHARNAQGALDAETQASLGIQRASQERRRSFEDLARSQHLSPPVQLSERTKANIDRFDPGILPDAQRSARRQAESQARSAQHERLLAYQQSDAPLSSKIGASFTGRPPGEARIGNRGSGFMEGLLGSEGRLDKVIGQAARFGLVYGALYSVMGAVTGAVSNASAGALQYEEALISLNLATAQGTEQNKALAEQAARAGTALGFGPAEGIQAASRAIGLYDLNAPGTTDSDRTDLGIMSTEVAGRIARISGDELQQVQTQVAGLVRSFNLSPFQQSRVEDTLAVISRQSGRNPAELLQASTQLAPTAHKAGYDLPDTLAMVSQVASQTGQSADAVAGQLSQVLSKAGDPAAMARLAGVGVNVTGTNLKQQVSQLAGLNLDPNTRAQTVQAFGRSRSGAAFDILLGQQERVDSLAKQGRDAEPGTGERTFDEVMTSLSKVMLETKGTLQNIANGLAQAGLFQVVGHLVGLFSAMAQVLDTVIQMYTSLPAPLRDGIAGIVEAIIAVKLFTFVMRSSAIAAGLAGMRGFFGKMAAVGGGAGIAGAARGVYTPAALAALLGGSGAGAARLAGARAVVGAGAKGIGVGLARTVLPLVGGVPGLVIGGTIAAGVGAYHADEASRNTQRLALQARSAQGAAGNAEEMRQAAGRTDEAVAAAQKQQELSFGNFLSQGLSPWLLRAQGAYTRELTAPAKVEAEGQQKSEAQRKAADELELQHERSIAASGANAFQDFASSSAVSNGLEILADRGLSAAQRLEALNKAFDGLIISSSNAEAAVGYIGQGAGEEFATAAASAPGAAVEDVRLKLANNVEQIDPVTDMGLWDRVMSKQYRLRMHHQDPADTPAGRLVAKDRKDRDILNEVDTPKMAAESNAAISSYLKTVGKDPAKGDVALDAENIMRINQIEQGVALKYLPKVSTSTFADVVRTLDLQFKEKTKGFVNTEPNLGDITNYIGAAVPLAHSAAEEKAAIARDPNLAPGFALKELDAARARSLDLVSKMPLRNPDEIQAKADALNAVNSALDADIAKTLDAATVARAAVVDATVRDAQSFLMVEDTVGRRAEELKGLADKLKAPVMSGADIATLRADSAVLPLSEAQRKAANAAISTKIAGSMSPKEAAKLEAEQRDLLAQQVVDEREGRRATAAGRLAIGDYQKTDVFVGADPKALLDQTLANAKEDVKRLKDLPDTSQAKGEALQRLAAAAAAEQQYAIELGIATAKLGVRANDTVALAQLEIDDALDEYSRAKASGDKKGMKDAELKIRDARLKKISAATTDRSNQRSADLIPNSVLGGVKNNLEDAIENLENAKLHDIGSVAEMQGRYNTALYEFTSAQLDFTQQLAGGYDPTDPVQAGEKALKDIQDRLSARDKDGKLLESDPQRRALLNKQAETQRLENEKTAEDQRLQAIDDYEQLGKITHEDALAMRKAERANMVAELASMERTDEAYHQKEQDLIALDKRIKQSTDQMQGQFNIGGIKLPTVYEIRRSLGLSGDEMKSNVGDYSHSNNNVTINGVDFVRVVSYIESILGKPTRNVRANSPRLVG